MDKKTKLIFLFAAIIFLAGSFFFAYRPAEKAFSGSANGAYDIIGTKSGTTTTGLGFYELPATNGTTSIPLVVRPETDLVSFTIQVDNASTSAAFSWRILASNDTGCETSTTTTVFADTITMDQINWFDVNESAQSLYPSEGMLTATNATGTTVMLDDLNYACLLFEANGSSTSAWVQSRFKAFGY